MRTSAALPMFCTCTSPRPRPSTLPRMAPMSAVASWLCTSITVPPLKSMPALTPIVKKSANDTTIRTSEIGVRMRAHFMKGRLVLSGIRRNGMAESLERHDLRPCVVHPGRNDQAGDQIGGEKGRDDADGEGDRESADRPRAEPEQGDCGNQRRQMRV